MPFPSFILEQGYPWQRTGGWKWQGCQTEEVNILSMPSQSSTCLLQSLQGQSPGPMIQATLKPMSPGGDFKSDSNKPARRTLDKRVPCTTKGQAENSHEAQAIPQSHQGPISMSPSWSCGTEVTKGRRKEVGCHWCSQLPNPGKAWTLTRTELVQRPELQIGG